MSPVPRHLHVVRPFSHYATPVTLPGSVHHHIPVQVSECTQVLVNGHWIESWIFNLTDCVCTLTDRWTWVPRWLWRVTAKDKPRPLSRPASLSRQVRDRPPPHRVPRLISRLDRDRLAPGSSGSATRQSRWLWCRWTRMVCCPLPAPDWMPHYIKAVCVLYCWGQCVGVQWWHMKHCCFRYALLLQAFAGCFEEFNFDLIYKLKWHDSFFLFIEWCLCSIKYTSVVSNILAVTF